MMPDPALFSVGMQAGMELMDAEYPSSVGRNYFCCLFIFTSLSLWDNQSGKAGSSVSNPEPTPGFGLCTRDPFFGCLLEFSVEFVAGKETG